jgi:hypothetical protein
MPPGDTSNTSQEPASSWEKRPNGARLVGTHKAANASTNSLDALGFVTAGDKVEESLHESPTLTEAPVPDACSPGATSASNHGSVADKAATGAAEEAAFSPPPAVRLASDSAVQVNPVMAHMQQIWSQPLGDDIPCSPRAFRSTEASQGHVQQGMQDADAPLSQLNGAADLPGLLGKGLQAPGQSTAPMSRPGEGFAENGSEERAMSIMRKLLNGSARGSGDLASILDSTDSGQPQDQVTRLQALSLAAGGHGGGNGGIGSLNAQGIPLRQDAPTAMPSLPPGYSSEQAKAEGQYAKMLYDQALAAAVQRPSNVDWSVEQGGLERTVADPLSRGRAFGGVPAASLQLLQQLQYGERNMPSSLVHAGQTTQQPASMPVALEGLGLRFPSAHENRDVVLRRQQHQVRSLLHPLPTLLVHSCCTAFPSTKSQLFHITMTALNSSSNTYHSGTIPYTIPVLPTKFRSGGDFSTLFPRPNSQLIANPRHGF